MWIADLTDPASELPFDWAALQQGGPFSYLTFSALDRRAMMGAKDRPMLHITPDVALQDWELSESFMRASGPGGQNVNKVSSAVTLRFEAARSPSLSAPVKARLRRLAGRRWTQEGAILIQCDESRSQARNREIAKERLGELIRKALIAPKRRVATRPTLGSKKRRLQAKKQRGEIKAGRGKIDPSDV